MDMSNGGRITDGGARTGHTHPAEEVNAIPLTSLNNKGDIIVATGNDAYYVLPVGSEGTALCATPSATPGVAWAAPTPKSHTHTQAESHQSADTNTSASSLHHTLGTGALNAAAGNHGHADIVPIGAIFPYAGTSAPTGYLICDGSAQSIATYPTLASVCGSNFGPQTSTSFRLPNLQARVPFGLSSGTTGFTSVGLTGGASSVTLAEANMPSHTHSTPNHSHTTQSHNHTVTAHTHAIGTHTHNVSGGTDSQGGHSHNVSVTVVSGGEHQHDTRIRDASNFQRDSTDSGAVWFGTNTNNMTAMSGSHDHTATVTESEAGSHGHGVSGSTDANTSPTNTESASDTLTEATVTINNDTGSGTTGSTPSTTATSFSVVPPYITLNYIIKAL